MLIGIVADIHDAVSPLGIALTRFRGLGVERVVSLGDAFETYQRGGPAAEIARMLREAGAVGVWGNHDFGLSHAVTDEVRQRADPAVLSFASGLQPQLVIENCRFSHVEPWLDPRNVGDLWYFDGGPDSPTKASRCFDAVAERFLFMGHLHQWLIVNSKGDVTRDVTEALTLTSADRYLVVMGAVVDGWCATFDSVTAELTPVRCSQR